MVHDDDQREEAGDIGREAGWQHARVVLDDGKSGGGGEHTEGQRAGVGTRVAKANRGCHGRDREQDARRERDPGRGVAVEKRWADPQQQAGRQKRLEEKQDAREKEQATSGRSWRSARDSSSSEWPTASSPP